MAATTTPAVATRSVVAVRWPLQPLLDATGLPRTILAIQAGTTMSTLRAAEQDGLTDEQADRWAIRLGQHPAMVWGAAWLDAAGDIEAVAADRPAAARVAARLRARIAAGDLAAGDVVPSIDELAAATGHGRGVAAKALAALAADGVIASASGRRVVAGGPPAERRGEVA
jgi:hypothetical protein